MTYQSESMFNNLELKEKELIKATNLTQLNKYLRV